MIRALSDLHGKFVVAATEAPSSQESISQLGTFARGLGLEVPPDYLALVKLASEIEIEVGNLGYIRIWSADGVMEMNREYEVQKYLPDALAIGDDEGGKAILVMRGAEGAGVYRLPFADLDRDEAVFIASSLSELLQNGVGIDKLFD